MQRPRVANYPTYSASSGLEAIELAASAGLILDPWQGEEILVPAMGERPDGTWSAFEVGCVVPRQNGKGGVIEARELWGLFLGGERLILHSAHEFKTAMEAFRRIDALITNTDDLRRRVRRVTTGTGNECIELLNGARLRFLARSKGSGRGFTGDCVILDEAYELSQDEMAALFPTLSARPNPQLWYFSTPPQDPAAVLVALRKRGQAGTEKRLAYFEYSPPEGFTPTPKSAPATELDRAMWAATNPALGIRISEEFIVSERGALGDDEFARERLGIWPPSADGEWQVIGEAPWRARADLRSRPLDPVAFAVDVSPDRASCIAVAGRAADGRLHVEVIRHMAGTSWVVPQLLRLMERHKPCAVVLDAAGLAGSLLASLEAEGIEVTKPTAREAAQACGQFFDAVCGDAPYLTHLDQGPLTTALAGAQKRPLGDAWAWNRRSVNVDISPLVAVTLAAWGHSTEGHKVKAPTVPLAAWA